MSAIKERTHETSPSQISPRLDQRPPVSGNATILSRSAPEGGIITYTIQIGSVSIPDVSVIEITDYVSPYDLEVFENAAFQQEIAEQAAAQTARLAAKQKSRKQRRNGYASSTSSSLDDESGSGSSVSGDKAEVGRRQRPSYTHFYPKQRAPRGSVKTTSSVEIVVPIHQRQTSGNEGKSINHLNLDSTSLTSDTAHTANKRRRTGEDRSSVSSAAQESVYSINSLDQPTQPPTAMEQAAGIRTNAQLSDPMDLDANDTEMTGNDNNNNVSTRNSTRSTSVASEIKGKTKSLSSSKKASAKDFFTLRTHAASDPRNVQAQSSQPLSAKAKLAAQSTGERASEPPARAMPPPPSSSSAAAKAKAADTATTAPRQASAPVKPSTAATTGAPNANPPTSKNPRNQTLELDPTTDSEDEDDSSDPSSEFYTVETILAHNLSDPSTHDTSLHGTDPVMLYQVKWEGYDEPTWEPASSFQDEEMLEEYWAKQAQRQKRVSKK